MKEKIKQWLVCLFIIAGAFLFGFYAGYRYYVPELKAALDEAKLQNSALHKMLDSEQQKPPRIITETRTKTEIAYVPKETVIYRDSISEKETSAKEKTDVQLDVRPPSVSMKYNGISYEMSGIAGETTKFEQGKLVGEVSTAATVDVTDLVNREVSYRLAEEEKNITVGGYLTNEGFVGSIGLIRGNQEYKVIGKVPKLREFYGAGVEFKF